jgi:hypothetical protein
MRKADHLISRVGRSSVILFLDEKQHATALQRANSGQFALAPSTGRESQASDTGRVITGSYKVPDRLPKIAIHFSSSCFDTG